MSEFKIVVVRVGELVPHSNADTLDVTRVYDYPVIVKRGQFTTGQTAVYVPVDSVVPADDPKWAFLSGSTRIRAKKLRGVFSMGLLTDADPSWAVGKDVREELRITKYEPPEPMVMGGEIEACSELFPVFTDIEGLRRNPGILVDDEEVVISEKLHGACSRFLWSKDRLWVGSHTQVKRSMPEKQTIWWKVAERYGLADKLRMYPGIVFYGEIYGYVQDLHYGTTVSDKLRLAFFDAFDTAAGKYVDAQSFFDHVDLPMVPVLYRGEWKEDLRSLAEGMSTVAGADHVREGIVIRPIRERFDERIGRVILKLHGEGYLLRKENKA